MSSGFLLFQTSKRNKIQKFGRKTQTEYQSSVEKCRQNTKVRLKNASGTWHTYESGFDFIAHRLIFKIFDEYQDTGEIPESVGLFW